MRTKKDLVPGKKYRGYGVMNEYGEFTFEPEETGANAGRQKQISSQDGVTVSHTKDNLLIHIKVPKCPEKYKLILTLMHKFNILTDIIKSYDF